MKEKISIGAVGSNPTVRFIGGGVKKNMNRSETLNNSILRLKCTEITDNKTTYTQKKIWDDINEEFIFPPYAECDYVI